MAYGLRVEVMDTYGAFWWVTKNSNRASGKEFSSREDAEKDALKVLGRDIRFVTNYSPAFTPPAREHRRGSYGED